MAIYFANRGTLSAVVVMGVRESEYMPALDRSVDWQSGYMPALDRACIHSAAAPKL